jgi:uncharacterized lipoprotein YddW (UPF0748 family)
MVDPKIFVWCLLFTGTHSILSAITYERSTIVPPIPPREFRGAWVATVGNIDWPSKPGLPSAQQKAELVAILDRAVQLRLNAIIFQVRPACDALYAASLEPWSEYLTGQMGKAPEPFYDPLAFTVEEAHKRGLELHAWFNPFRVRYSKSISPASANHVSKLRPHLVRQYGNFLWLDPGEKAAQEYSLSVIVDVVKRYDLDGVHLDDYFYPYPETDAAGKVLDFPDYTSWKRYGAGGTLSRADWRRQNINTFIHTVYRTIKGQKPWVKFGVSPFGIWRPGHPTGINGFDAYDKLYADSRQWLANGWVDYFSPQLYWSIHPAAQSYSMLLDWWADQNSKNRHLWPGVSTAKVGRDWTADEIVNQIRITRRQKGATGNVHWNISSLTRNRGSIADALLAQAYAQPSLVPASSWLDNVPPVQPALSVATNAASTEVKFIWQPKGAEKIWLWAFQTRTGGRWRLEILPSIQTSQVFNSKNSALPEIVSVRAIDRCGNASTAAVIESKRATK